MAPIESNAQAAEYATKEAKLKRIVDAADELQAALLDGGYLVPGGSQNNLKDLDKVLTDLLGDVAPGCDALGLALDIWNEENGYGRAA